jgi:bifunctional UDP-N-acetylglucosamine pyrophosphorylase/glucosamine-1-phosphate N-acetyltransferase
MTTKIENPSGYGRILRHADGRLADIREDADCSADEKKIKEINAGIYGFKIGALLEALAKVQNRNKQGEYYLPDVVKWLASNGWSVQGIPLSSASECLGINDRVALLNVEQILMREHNQKLLLNGVSLQNPENTYVDPRCKFGTDIVVESGCVLVRSTFANGTYIESNCRIFDSTVGEDSVVKQGSYLEESVIGKDCQVGPYAHLRPESVLANKVKIGNFVEIKKSTIGEGSKANHLAYVGDATVGKDVNLGCGFITCNYDGIRKNKTTIEDGVFVGSDSQTVAPLTIGAGSFIAAGTTLTRNVPPNSLAISRGRQENKENYARRFRQKPK